MINFLLTNWWIYIPIIAILLFLTAVNNQKIQQLSREKKLRELPPQQRQDALLTDLKRKPSKFEATTKKLGLRGIFSYIFPKR